MSQLTNLHSEVDGELLHLYSENFRHETSDERIDLSDTSWNIQISSLKFVDNRHVKPHVHLPMDRKVSQTLSHEIWIVTSGDFEVKFFDKDCKTVIEVVKATTGFVAISLHGLHSIKAITEGSTFLEIKNGPYVGRDIEYVS